MKRLNNFKKNKGLSTIVSTLLILLLVFVAVAILWVVVRNVISQGTEQVSLGKFTLDLKIEQVSINENSNSVSLKVKRNSGEGEFVGLKIIVSDDDNSDIFNENISLEVYEKKTFNLNLIEVNSSKIKKIEIVPIFQLSSGKQIVGDVKDTWEKSDSGNYYSGEIWTPECYNDSQCSDDKECVNSYCVLKNCESNSSCALTTCVGSTCQDTCGNVFSGQLNPDCPSLYYGTSPNGCGFCQCPSGYTASGSNCVLESPQLYCGDEICSSSINENCSNCEADCGECDGNYIEVLYYNDFEDDTVGKYLSQDSLDDWHAIPFIQSIDNTPMFPHASIYLENGNKVFRNDFEEGSLWCNDNGCFRANHYMGEGRDELYLSYMIKVSNGWAGSKGKIPSLNAYLTATPGGAGQCVTGYDRFTARMMFFGTSNGIGLQFYPYHIRNWEGDFYRDAFYDVKGYYPSSCEEVLEFVCDGWYCYNGVWHETAWTSELADFVSAYGREPNSALEFGEFIHNDRYVKFINEYGRQPNSCTEFAVYVNKDGAQPVLCGGYSGSGREIEGFTIESNRWYKFTERVVANDIGEENGYIEIFIDDKFIDRLEGLEFRATPDLKINNIGFDGFFGGDEGDEPKQDVTMYIDNVIVYRYLQGSGEPLGQEKSSSNRILPEVII